MTDVAQLPLNPYPMAAAGAASAFTSVHHHRLSKAPASSGSTADDSSSSSCHGVGAGGTSSNVGRDAILKTIDGRGKTADFVVATTRALLALETLSTGSSGAKSTSASAVDLSFGPQVPSAGAGAGAGGAPAPAGRVMYRRKSDFGVCPPTPAAALSNCHKRRTPTRRRSSLTEVHLHSSGADASRVFSEGGGGRRGSLVSASGRLSGGTKRMSWSSCGPGGNNHHKKDKEFPSAEAAAAAAADRKARHLRTLNQAFLVRDLVHDAHSSSASSGHHAHGSSSPVSVASSAVSTQEASSASAVPQQQVAAAPQSKCNLDDFLAATGASSGDLGDVIQGWPSLSDDDDDGDDDSSVSVVTETRYKSLERRDSMTVASYKISDQAQSQVDEDEEAGDADDVLGELEQRGTHHHRRRPSRRDSVETTDSAFSVATLLDRTQRSRDEEEEEEQSVHDQEEEEEDLVHSRMNAPPSPSFSPPSKIEDEECSTASTRSWFGSFYRRQSTTHQSLASSGTSVVSATPSLASSLRGSWFSSSCGSSSISRSTRNGSTVHNVIDRFLRTSPVPIYDGEHGVWKGARVDYRKTEGHCMVVVQHVFLDCGEADADEGDDARNTVKYLKQFDAERARLIRMLRRVRVEPPEALRETYPRGIPIGGVFFEEVGLEDGI